MPANECSIDNCVEKVDGQVHSIINREVIANNNLGSIYRFITFNARDFPGRMDESKAKKSKEKFYLNILNFISRKIIIGSKFFE